MLYNATSTFTVSVASYGMLYHQDNIPAHNSIVAIAATIPAGRTPP